MAAVSQRHAAAPHGLPFSKSVRNLNQEPDKRNIDNPGFSSDYNDNSDAYSFEARSDVSDDRDGSAAAAAAASTRSGEAVRPDSLAMTSPLEQLTRSLSFNKKDSPSSVSSHGKMSSARLRQLQEKESGLPPVEQVMLEYLASEPTREAGLSTDAQLDIEGSDAMAYQPGFTKDQGQQLRSIGNASRKPVRSSEDSDQAGGAEDADTQGQLINAFRSSYHTYMTRSGGLRDSSYSWMAPDADSPNATMDFKQAGIPNSNEVENSRGLESYEAKFSGNDGLNESSDAYSQWEAEDDRAQARRSSWDSQAVRKMALHRVPSQKASKTLTDDRTSAPSVNEPFHYSVSIGNWPQPPLKCRS